MRTYYYASSGILATTDLRYNENPHHKLCGTFSVICSIFWNRTKLTRFNRPAATPCALDGADNTHNIIPNCINSSFINTINVLSFMFYP
jgi:hypothetical protein